MDFRRVPAGRRWRCQLAGWPGPTAPSCRAHDVEEGPDVAGLAFRSRARWRSRHRPRSLPSFAWSVSESNPVCPGVGRRPGGGKLGERGGGAAERQKRAATAAASALRAASGVLPMDLTGGTTRRRREVPKWLRRRRSPCLQAVSFETQRGVAHVRGMTTSELRCWTLGSLSLLVVVVMLALQGCGRCQSFPMPSDENICRRLRVRREPGP